MLLETDNIPVYPRDGLVQQLARQVLLRIILVGTEVCYDVALLLRCLVQPRPTSPDLHEGGSASDMCLLQGTGAGAETT